MSSTLEQPIPKRGTKPKHGLGMFPEGATRERSSRNPSLGDRAQASQGATPMGLALDRGTTPAGYPSSPVMQQVWRSEITSYLSSRSLPSDSPFPFSSIKPIIRVLVEKNMLSIENSLESVLSSIPSGPEHDNSSVSLDNLIELLTRLHNSYPGSSARTSPPAIPPSSSASASATDIASTLDSRKRTTPLPQANISSIHVGARRRERLSPGADRYSDDEGGGESPSHYPGRTSPTTSPLHARPSPRHTTHHTEEMAYHTMEYPPRTPITSTGRNTTNSSRSGNASRTGSMGGGITKEIYHEGESADTIRTLSKANADLKKKNAELDHAYSDAERRWGEQIAALQADLDEKNAELVIKRKSIVTHISSEKVKAGQVDALERQVAEISDRLHESKVAQQSLRHSYDASQEENRDLRASLLASEDQLRHYSRDVEEMKAEHQRITEDRAFLQDRLADTETHLQAVTNMHAEDAAWKERYEALEVQVERLREEQESPFAEDAARQGHLPENELAVLDSMRPSLQAELEETEERSLLEDETSFIADANTIVNFPGVTSPLRGKNPLRSRYATEQGVSDIEGSFVDMTDDPSRPESLKSQVKHLRRQSAILAQRADKFKEQNDHLLRQKNRLEENMTELIADFTLQLQAAGVAEADKIYDLRIKSTQTDPEFFPGVLSSVPSQAGSNCSNADLTFAPSGASASDTLLARDGVMDRVTRARQERRQSLSQSLGKGSRGTPAPPTPRHYSVRVIILYTLMVAVCVSQILPVISAWFDPHPSRTHPSMWVVKEPYIMEASPLYRWLQFRLERFVWGEPPALSII